MKEHVQPGISNMQHWGRLLGIFIQHDERANAENEKRHGGRMGPHFAAITPSSLMNEIMDELCLFVSLFCFIYGILVIFFSSISHSTFCYCDYDDSAQ